MMNKKRSVAALTCLLMAGLLAGCQNGEKENTNEKIVPENVTEQQETSQPDGTAESTEPKAFENREISVAGWKINVEDCMYESSLKNASIMLGYTGVETSDYEKTAPEGKKFCLIKLNITKEGSKETIKWADMIMVDANGQVYNRMEDDFITELGMKRMVGTDLNFGSYEGWIAYEIDENATGLHLTYSFETEKFDCEL